MCSSLITSLIIFFIYIFSFLFLIVFSRIFIPLLDNLLKVYILVINMKKSNIKIVSWNINGIRAAVKNGFIKSVDKIKPDILCMQEIKSDNKSFPKQVKEFANKKGYFLIINPAQKKGYAGTAVLTRIKPLKIINKIGIDKFDAEGRFLLLEFDKFYLFNTYFPHSRRGLTRLRFKIEFDDAYLKFIEKYSSKNKPLILTGDFNVAHKEIDIANPKQNVNNAGFTNEERKFIDELIADQYVDTFRYLHPKSIKYSWWTYRFHARERNIGWRVDYFFIQKRFVRKIRKADILTNTYGSDHAPIILELVL